MTASDAQMLELEAQLARARGEVEQAKYMQAKAQEFGERMRAERDDSEMRLDAIATYLSDFHDGEASEEVTFLRNAIWLRFINAPLPFNRAEALLAARKAVMR